MVCHMTRSIRSKSRRSEICEKWLISKAVFSTNMHLIKRLMVNYDTSRQCLNFNWSDFLIDPHLASHDLQT